MVLILIFGLISKARVLAASTFFIPTSLEEVIICLFKLDSSITSPSTIVILVKPLLTNASKA